MTYHIKATNERLARRQNAVQNTRGLEWPLVLAFAIVGLVTLSFWPATTQGFAREGGLIETFSAVLLLVAALVSAIRLSGFGRIYLTLVCLLLAERELDEGSYAAGSLLQNLLSGIDVMLDVTLVRVVLAVFVLGGALRFGPELLRRAWSVRSPVLPVFAVSGLAAVLAQLVEKCGQIYEAGLTATASARFLVIEETLELYFSIGLLTALLIGLRARQTAETPDV